MAEAGDRAGRAEAEAALVADAQRYDLAALRRALAGLGYSDDDIEYRSNQTSCHQSSVVAAVELLRAPRRRAVVSVNLGLLGPQSPLPSYFQKTLDRQADGSLSAFLNFFADRLLRADIAGIFPERDPALFADFGQTRRQILSLLGLRAPSTVHALAQGVFPELEVGVRRTVLMRPIRTRGMIVGEWALGDGAVCGGVSTAPVSALALTLVCDHAETGTGEPWARAAERRLRTALFPLLARSGLFLRVTLVLRDVSSFLVLAPEQHLGYEPLYGGEGPVEPHTRTARTVVLWSGEVP